MVILTLWFLVIGLVTGIQEKGRISSWGDWSNIKAELLSKWHLAMQKREKDMSRRERVSL